MSETQEAAETFSFQAEVSRLLHLMVHSVYTEKEIFLRELISNSSDACDKLRYQGVTNPALLGDDTELKITLSTNKSANILTIHDNGIGMNREELVENLGTIAKSGTKAFLEKLEQEKDGSSLIGQFGVGFYSAFMVADQVEVISRKAGEDSCFVWLSKGGEGFSVEEATDEQKELCKRGTYVNLQLKEDARDYLNQVELERIVQAYSDHISFPIFLNTEAETEDQEAGPKQINSGSALWTRSKSEITEEDYNNFYKQVAVPFDDPSITLHYKAEGRHEYTVLLFVPKLKPFDLYDPERKGRVRLYVRRVYITDDADLLPPYLRFVRGVIDSQDVPLNISREMLQNNPIVNSIRNAVTKKVLSELKKNAKKNPEKHIELWEAFGAVLKEGLYEDYSNRDDLFEIARFKSTKDDSWRSLAQYVEDMREGQEAIYFLTGNSLDQLKSSPQLEGFKARGIEVLLMADSIDNFWVTNSAGYGEKQFQSITQGEVDISKVDPLEGKDDSTDDKVDSSSAVLIAKLKETLGEAISDVKVSKRLVNSPTCLVAPAGGPDRGLEKILNRGGEATSKIAPIMEVNLNHQLMQDLANKATDNSDEFSDLCWVLFDQALILEGELPSDPAKFSERLNRLIVR